MGLHTDEYAGKRSTLRLDKKETSKIIGSANRQNAAKLRKVSQDNKGKKRKGRFHLIVYLTESGKRRIRERELADFGTIGSLYSEHDGRGRTLTLLVVVIK
jgi:hypothetical protein